MNSHRGRFTLATWCTFAVDPFSNIWIFNWSSKKHVSKSITCFYASSYSPSLYRRRSPSKSTRLEMRTTTSSIGCSIILSSVESSVGLLISLMSMICSVNAPLGIAVNALQHTLTVPLIETPGSTWILNGYLMSGWFNYSANTDSSGTSWVLQMILVSTWIFFLSMMESSPIICCKLLSSALLFAAFAPLFFSYSSPMLPPSLS